MAIIPTPDSTNYHTTVIPNMPSVAYDVVQSDTDNFDNGIHIYVGVTGNIKVIPENTETPVTFLNFPGGLVLPVKVKRVFVTGTDATNLVGIE